MNKYLFLFLIILNDAYSQINCGAENRKISNNKDFLPPYDCTAYSNWSDMNNDILRIKIVLYLIERADGSGYTPSAEYNALKKLSEVFNPYGIYFEVVKII
ncbi:MAG: hypothetical protein HOP11_12610 [Saprospiraceae bacterium]|nr:hypothetical protein [Saprospiraceae bacterium]